MSRNGRLISNGYCPLLSRKGTVSRGPCMLGGSQANTSMTGQQVFVENSNPFLIVLALRACIATYLSCPVAILGRRALAGWIRANVTGCYDSVECLSYDCAFLNSTWMDLNGKCPDLSAKKIPYSQHFIFVQPHCGSIKQKTGGL